jgi:hypothetical protein
VTVYSNNKNKKDITTKFQNRNCVEKPIILKVKCTKNVTATHNKYQQKSLPSNKDQIAGKSLKLHHASYDMQIKQLYGQKTTKVKWHEKHDSRSLN